jgi:hypothetical protein
MCRVKGVHLPHSYSNPWPPIMENNNGMGLQPVKDEGPTTPLHYHDHDMANIAV